MERVSAIYGSQPVLLVCPHGRDDHFTDVITEHAASLGDFYAVINRGFARADEVDVLNDKADCNRVDHVEEDVVREEFLDSIIKFKNHALPRFGYLFVYHVHGFGDQVEKQAGEKIDVILGYGESEKLSSYSCEHWHKDGFISIWNNCHRDGTIYTGKGGGKYAARNSNNMNQYFRKHDHNPSVFSMQVEIARRIRSDKRNAEETGLTLAKTALSLSMLDPFKNTGGFPAMPNKAI